MTSPRASTRRRALRHVALFVLAVLVTLGVLVLRPDLPRAEVDARYTDAGSRHVQVDGLRVHYRDEGQGPVLVLIHGTSSSLHTWDGWTRELVSHRRVIRFDLPGYGLTGVSDRTPYDSTESAAFVGRFLDAIGVHEPVDLAGNSLGGLVAWRFAALSPGRVRKLVLVDPSGMPRKTRPLAFRLIGTPGLGGIGRWAGARFIFAGNVREVYGDDSRITDALIDRYQAVALREGNRTTLVRRFSRPDEPSHVAELARITAPTLIVWGTRDAWIPPAHAELFRRAIRGSSVLRVQGAGHVPMEERPLETARAVDAFLE